MEGILLDTVAFGFTTAAIHGAILIAAATGALFGYMEEEERAGARLTWAEWPVVPTFSTSRIPSRRRVIGISLRLRRIPCLRKTGNWWS